MWYGRQKHLVDEERSEENDQTDLSGQEGYSNSNKHALQTWWAEKQPEAYEQ